MIRRKSGLEKQMIKRVIKPIIKPEEFDGTFTGKNISTGSTLLDLAISGGRIRGGGLPGGVLVEIFGPNGSGKTVLLSEIAGDIQRKGGEVFFHDPEARLNQQFAKQFGMELKEGMYYQPDTIPEVFKAARKWEPKTERHTINGIMADSLAALSTDMEMEKEEGDKMGGRRAKEFSEELRKTCRILAQRNLLMVCSNQIRQNMDVSYGPKYSAPGGEAMGFYSSLRLRTKIENKIKKTKKFHGREVSRIVGVDIEVEVFKNSIWKPYHTAPVVIIFDYGIDDIRTNLQYVKEKVGGTVYSHNGENLDRSLEEAIGIIEESGNEQSLKEEVIELWEEEEKKFDSKRKPKRP